MNKRESTSVESKLISRLSQTADRLIFLSTVSRILNGALTENDCFDRLIGLVVPHMADWASINLLDENNKLNRVVYRHAKPERQGKLDALARLVRAHINDGVGPGHVIKTGKAEFRPHVSDEYLLKIFKTPDALKLMKNLEVTSLMAVPLKAHGKMLGALLLVRESGSFTQDDFNLVEDVADRASNAVYHMLKYENASERLEKVVIELQMREKYFATIRHDVLSALTTATLSVSLIARKYKYDELSIRTLEALERIADAIRGSGPSIPYSEAA